MPKTQEQQELHQHPFLSKRLPNKEYFLETDVENYNPVDYFRTFTDITEKSKEKLHGYWGNCIHVMINSAIQRFRDKGAQLEKLWKTPDQDLVEFWAAHASSLDEVLIEERESVQKYALRSAGRNIRKGILDIDAGHTAVTQQETKRRRVEVADDDKEEQMANGFNVCNNASQDARPCASQNPSQELLLLSDPTDGTYDGEDESDISLSRLFDLNYLEGEGQSDCGIKDCWEVGGVNISAALMKYRQFVVENNGALTEPHEKLMVNFIALVDSDYQNSGLQGEIDDEVWELLCLETQETVPPLPNELVVEINDWCSKLESCQYEEFKELLEKSPPKNQDFKHLLNCLTSTRSLWTIRGVNEDTTLKNKLAPFLDAFLGGLKYTTGEWTPVVDETRNTGRLLFSDYSSTTSIKGQKFTVFLCEGKVEGATQDYIWDDLTKLGQEMKLALDSIIKQQPEGRVSVIGVLVKEPHVYFYTMTLYGDGIYVMRRFAKTYLVDEAANPSTLMSLFRVMQFVKERVQTAVSELRKRKVGECDQPMVPLWWARPSFLKPKRILICD